jgi:xylan 1,4-beta-xylosidase
VGTEGIVQEEYSVPNLPQHIWEQDPARDDFADDSLRLSLNFVRNSHAADWSLASNPGFLRLNGSKINFNQKDSPAFICRRQTAFDIIASMEISIIPPASNEEAGLVVLGNNQNHYDFLTTRSAGNRVIMLRKYLQNQVVERQCKEIPEGDIILRISATELQYRFWYNRKGQQSPNA